MDDGRDQPGAPGERARADRDATVPEGGQAAGRRNEDSRLPAPVRWFVRFLEEVDRRYIKGRPL